MSGKGSTRRSQAISAAEAASNWTRTFGEADPEPPETLCACARPEFPYFEIVSLTHDGRDKCLRCQRPIDKKRWSA